MSRAPGPVEVDAIGFSFLGGFICFCVGSSTQSNPLVWFVIAFAVIFLLTCWINYRVLTDHQRRELKDDQSQDV